MTLGSALVLLQCGMTLGTGCEAALGGLCGSKDGAHHGHGTCPCGVVVHQGQGCDMSPQWRWQLNIGGGATGM